jgi:hypothetical protein
MQVVTSGRASQGPFTEHAGSVPIPDTRGVLVQMNASSVEAVVLERTTVESSPLTPYAKLRSINSWELAGAGVLPDPLRITWSYLRLC